MGDEPTPPAYALEQPSPEASPEEVVASILQALAANDRPRPDHGVAVVYAFASDRMRAGIGDEASLRRAFHNTLYRVLLDHRSAIVDHLERRSEAVRAAIVVTASDGTATRFTAALARAAHGERRGCWLLSGLAREGVDL